jgi:putative NADPH-quinone reductase
MRVLVVYCHPVPESFCAALRDTALQAINAKGCEARLVDLYAEKFDPVMTCDERRHYNNQAPADPALRAHIEHLHWAEAIVFVYPTWWYGLPAILKGWLDRVWTPGFAYDLTPEAWRGDINGRQPKRTHTKALIIQTTIFDKRAYDAGLREAMRMVIDEFTLTYPGIKNVEREYLYAVHGADDATRRGYLERAYALVLQF